MARLGGALVGCYQDAESALENLLRATIPNTAASGKVRAEVSYLERRLISRSLFIDTELTTEEKRRVEEDKRRRVSEKKYRAEVRAELQREFAPALKSSLPNLLGIGFVLVVAAVWYFYHFGP
jgi:hypothetical protein